MRGKSPANFAKIHEDLTINNFEKNGKRNRLSAGKLDFDDKVVCHRMCPCGTSLEPPSNAVAWEGLRNDGPPSQVEQSKLKAL